MVMLGGIEQQTMNNARDEGSAGGQVDATKVFKVF